MKTGDAITVSIGSDVRKTDPLRKACAHFVNTITTGLEIIFFGLLLLVAIDVLTDHKVHACTAPCTVNFDAENMQEDMAGIDYRNGKVYVKQVRP